MSAPIVQPKNTDKLQTALAKAEPVESSLQLLIQKATKELGRALPAHLSPERMVRIALTTIRLNPELAKCSPESFMGSLFVLGQLGLEPINGQAYILPFNNKRKVGAEWKTVKEAQAIIGFKGYLNLFYRHDSSLSLDVQAVYEKDDFEYEHGTRAFLRHKPAKNDRGQAVGFYAVARLKGGASLFHYMSADEALSHGKAHSKTFDSRSGRFYESSPWATEFEAMAKKTCVLQLAKLLPLSFELQRALTVDETSRDYRDGIDSALDLPVTTTWSKVESEPEPTPEPVVTAPIPESKTGVANPDPSSFSNFVGK